MSLSKRHQAPEPRGHQRRTTWAASRVPSPKSKPPSSSGAPSHADPKRTRFPPRSRLHPRLHVCPWELPRPSPACCGAAPVILGRREQDHVRSIHRPQLSLTLAGKPQCLLCPPTPAIQPLPTTPASLLPRAPPVAAQAGARTFWRNTRPAQPASQPHPSPSGSSCLWSPDSVAPSRP